MKYIVLYNGKPAKFEDNNEPWNNNEFDTAIEATEYAANWLGDWCPDNDTFQRILEGHPYDCSGNDDFSWTRTFKTLDASKRAIWDLYIRCSDTKYGSFKDGLKDGRFVFTN